jgi:hypothetical protein
MVEFMVGYLGCTVFTCDTVRQSSLEFVEIQDEQDKVALEDEQDQPYSTHDTDISPCECWAECISLGLESRIGRTGRYPRSSRGRCKVVCLLGQLWPIT